MNDERTSPRATEVVTVTLDPAIDQTVTICNFAAGQVNRVEHMLSNAGGKGVNVASVLADYGHKVAATGFLGRENAALFENLFAQKRIEDCFVRIAGQTRVGIKITDPVQQQTTDINFPGEMPETDDVNALVRQLKVLNAEWFVLAGSLPPNVEATIYRDLIVALRARGCKIALDTSDQALWHALDAAPHIIKPNIHELEALVGEPLPTREAIIKAARTLLRKGIELVVVSMGKDGACFVTKDEVVIAHPPDVKVKSTVGAGDAMVSGIVAAQLRHLPLATCARLATAFSLDALSRIGAGLTSATAVEALMNQVTVEEVQG